MGGRVWQSQEMVDPDAPHPAGDAVCFATAGRFGTGGSAPPRSQLRRRLCRPSTSTKGFLFES